MATYSVLPDNLDIVFVQGDELNVLLDFDQDLTGFTFEAKLINVIAVSGGNVTDFESVYDLTQTIVNLSTGQINLSLNETQTSALLLNGNYRWFFRWFAPGLVTRTVLSGSVSVRSP